ncbi:MAG: HPr(Ser) kinase/phosphatase [Verrucomicrobiota bacterium]
MESNPAFFSASQGNSQKVTVEHFYRTHSEDLGLKLIAGEKGLKRIIQEPTVNRPGLVLAGFMKFFSFKRVQVIGSAETAYLKSRPPEERLAIYRRMFGFRMPCLVFSRNLNPERAFLELAEAHRVPIFKCPMPTVRFINQATLALEWHFAPRGSEMGSMVDILGVGVIIKGESGIGKSESVLALIERGYSLVADDITKLTVLDGREIFGTCSEVTRNHMEVRGIGIINVASMFGVKAIRDKKRVDLVVTLRNWEEVPDIDRLGMQEDFVEILGIKVPHITIPVRPGRDLARLVEVAAFQTKLRASGHNAAQDLEAKILSKMAIPQ